MATMNHLVAPMASSSVFKKLEELLEQTASTSEPSGPKGKGDDKTKTKRKKGKGKGKSDQVDGRSSETNSPPTWSPMVYPLDVGLGEGREGRQKTALDDFMSVVLEIFQNYTTKVKQAEASEKTMADWDRSRLSTFSHCVSCFMEFSWSGSVALNGKFARTYSGFREELITFTNTACELGLSSIRGSTPASTGGALSVGACLSDLLEIDTTCSSSFSIGQLKA